MMAPMFGLTPGGILNSPLALIGTPEECVVELKRRAKDWGISQFFFSSMSGMDESQLRRLKEDILDHV